MSDVLVAPTENNVAPLTGSRTDLLAKFSGGGPASPNLPVGQWEFEVDDQTGTWKETVAYKKDKPETEENSYKHFSVFPKGNPNGVKRRVYSGVVVAESAAKLLFDAAGTPLRGATFGVASYKEAGMFTTVVSADSAKITAEQAKGSKLYAAEKAAKAEAEKV